jgi:hypothetical protein
VTDHNARDADAACGQLHLPHIAFQARGKLRAAMAAVRATVKIRRSTYEYVNKEGKARCMS